MGKQIKDNRIIPYFQVENDLIDKRKDLTTSEKMVYIVLCRYTNNGQTAFPSYDTIADGASINRRTAIRVVESLLKKGLLHKKVRKDKNSKENKSNLYSLESVAVATYSDSPSDIVSPPSDIVSPPSDIVSPKKEQLKKNNLNKKPIVEDSLLTYFCGKYELATGKSYTKQNKDILTLKALKESRTETEIKDIIDFYFSSNDQFLKTRGYTISKIISCVLPIYDIKDKQQQQQNNNAVPQMNNYDQREYDEEHLRSFYCNID